MDIYIVDSNIIFSAALSIKSGIGQFILKTKENDVELYAPKYLKVELERHFDKIVKKSKLAPKEINLAIEKIYQNITFISDEIIPFEEYVKAMRLVRNIDPDDVTFVALANYMDSILWTGDQKLYKGLKKLGYKNVVNFKDLSKIYKF